MVPGKKRWGKKKLPRHELLEDESGIDGMSDFDFSSLRYLLVDESRHMRQLMRSIITAAGGRFFADANDGSEALKTLSEFKADIILSEINLTPMDGLEMVAALRSNTSDDFNAFTPVILITAHTEYETIIKARDTGINEILAKPVSQEALLKRIMAVVRNPREFIKVKDYVGPDRRRKSDQMGALNARRSSDQQEPTLSGPLTQEQIEALLE